MHSPFILIVVAASRWNICKAAYPSGVDMTYVRTSQTFRSTEDRNAYVSWLRPLPWSLFATLTFAWHVSDARAVGVFEEFVNRLERFIRGPVAFVRGDEKRFSGCGMPGAPRHFHAVFAAHQRL